MTAATLTHLPLQAGGAVLASAGRAALWVIARFMRAPLTNSAIGALVGMSLLAGSNALFGQQHEHPAPLFGVMQPALVDPNVELVIPATRPKKVKPLVVTPAPRLLSPISASGPIGNKEVFEIQRKLEMLQLFTGTVDGYYGPQTARAIKKFEERSGLKPKGELSQEIIELIRNAPLSMAEPIKAPVVEAAPVPAAQPLPKLEAEPVVQPAPVEVEVEPQSLAAIQPLPEPEPLTMEIQTGSVNAAAAPVEPKALVRPLPDTPQEALDMAAETAGDAIETIISGVQTVAMTKPGNKVGVESEAKVAALALEQPATRELAALPALPKAGVPLKIVEIAPKPNEEIAVLEGDAKPEDLMPAFSVTDPVIVAKVQRGLGSLGFLHGPSDGVAGEATAKAIRNFEVYFNYKVTGRITPELLDLLMQNGASI